MRRRSSRSFQIQLTELEASRLLHALGNSIDDGADQDIFESAVDRSACWRGYSKIRDALQVSRSKRRDP